MALPHRFGMISAWITGLLVDVLYADPLGVNGFCLAALTYVTWSFYERFRMYSVAQQGVVVFLLVLGTEFIRMCAQWVSRDGDVVVLDVRARGDEHRCMAVGGNGAAAHPISIRRRVTDGAPGCAQLVLASASPRRAALLTQLGIAFTVKAPDIDETRAA